MKSRALTSPVCHDEAGAPSDSAVREIVVVASRCDRFDEFVAAAGQGRVGLHFCVDGRSALRMARRFRADAWLVSLDLPDMSGLDLLEMLMPAVGRRGNLPRPGVFAVADRASVEDEQRALRAGAAGYLTGTVSVEILREARAGRQSWPLRRAPPGS